MLNVAANGTIDKTTGGGTKIGNYTITVKNNGTVILPSKYTVKLEKSGVVKVSGSDIYSYFDWTSASTLSRKYATTESGNSTILRVEHIYSPKSGVTTAAYPNWSICYTVTIPELSKTITKYYFPASGGSTLTGVYSSSIPSSPWWDSDTFANCKCVSGAMSKVTSGTSN